MPRRPTAPLRGRPTAGPSAGPRRPPRSGAAPSGRSPQRPTRPVSASGSTAAGSGGPDGRPGEATPVRLARLLSVRAMVLGVVLLIAFTLVFPTVRAFLGQRAQLEALTADVVAAEQREKELQAELDRWRQPAYIQAQARERLSFVMPGETAYRVIDPEVVVEQPPVGGGATDPEAGPTLPLGGSGTPWYTTIWTSVRIAGQIDVPGAP